MFKRFLSWAQKPEENKPLRVKKKNDDLHGDVKENVWRDDEIREPPSVRGQRQNRQTHFKRTTRDFVVYDQIMNWLCDRGVI